MTTKTISSSGYVGYSLKSTYDQLVVNSTGSIGGTYGGAGGPGTVGGHGGVALTVDHTASVENQGFIVGGAGGYSDVRGGAGGDGVYLENGGSLTNSGEISGGHGGGAGPLAQGGGGGAGVVLTSGGTVTNTGTITGGSPGTGGQPASAGPGVILDAGGTLLNQAGGTITNTYHGFVAYGAATVVNYGDITSSGVDRFNSSSGRMVVGAGSSEVGLIDGGYLATLEIGGGTAGSSGTIIGLGAYGASLSGGATARFWHFNAYVIDAGASWTLANGSLGIGKTLTVDGTLTIGGSVQSYGTILGGAGTNGVSAVGGSGIDALHGGASATFINKGQVLGGGGGAGGGATFFPFGYDGGPGGAGLSLASGGTVTNYGTIGGGAGGVGGVDEFAGPGGAGGTGLIASQATNHGLIEGGAGGYGGFGIYGGFGGVGGTGVALQAGGQLGNYGTIAGGGAGAPGSGLGVLGLPGSQGTGVAIDSGGYLRNGDSGETTAPVIKGGLGVYGGAGATVVNFGSIQGFNGESVQFTDASDKLVAEDGSVFTGSIVGGTGTLELAGGTGAISGLGATGTITGGVSAVFTGFGTYDLDAGGSWTLNGANSVGAAQGLVNAGSLTIGASSALTVAGALTNSGEIDVDGGGGKAFAGLVFLGNETLSGGGTVSLNATGYIGGPAAGDSLTNLDNTIEGGGFIKGPVTLTNDGTINADRGRMVLNTGDTVTNHGIIEATKNGVVFSAVSPFSAIIQPGLLLVRDTVIDSSGGGTVFDSSTIQLDNATLAGGALTVNAGAMLRSVFHSATINLGGGTVSNAGTIEGRAGGGLTIDGAVGGGGLIEASGGGLTVTGGVSGGNARIVGTGVLEVDGALGENVFFAAGSTGELVLGEGTGFSGRVYG
ncbi:MAG TPA: hypothetical protein VGH15_08495, partial [Caulobacteraceae bacterium]